MSDVDQDLQYYRQRLEQNRQVDDEYGHAVMLNNIERSQKLRTPYFSYKNIYVTIVRNTDGLSGVFHGSIRSDLVSQRRTHL